MAFLHGSAAPALDDEDHSLSSRKRKKNWIGDFCRGCGYCMPCPAGILINNCARMSLMVRRAPSKALAQRDLAGKYEEDRRMSPLQQMHEKMSLPAEYAGAASEKLRRLQEDSGRRNKSLLTPQAGFPLSGNPACFLRNKSTHSRPCIIQFGQMLHRKHTEHTKQHCSGQ